MSEEESQDVPQHSEFVKKYYWLIRPCEDYKKEAAECQALKSRFHQYFIHGSFTDCGSWLQNSLNCPKCTEDFNEVSCREIIKNESIRRLKRIEGHKNNDVWEKRTEPPDNWNPSLPTWFFKEKRYSLFDQKEKEFIDFMENSDPHQSYCTIL